MKYLRRSIFFRILLLVVSPLALSAATINGVVTDQLGAFVPNAKVHLLANGVVIASTTTDATGRYQLQNVQSGRFQLRAEAPTFQPTEIPSFYVRSSESATVNLLLRPPLISEEVVVTATGVPTSEAQVGSSVTVLDSGDYLNKLDVLGPLRSVPGVQITQTGQRGGTTSLFMRGGSFDTTKVLIDGVPANDIGGNFEFGDLAATSFDQIEVFRGPNSILYGSDALAGVISLTTRRGSAPLPELTYAADGGNFGTYRQEGTMGGSWRPFDYFSSFTRFDTSNSVPNDRFHNGTYVGNFGWSPASAHSFRVTVRHVSTAMGVPNSIDLFGIADNGRSQDRDAFISATYENHATSKWHNLVRYGAARINSDFSKPSPAGVFDSNSGEFFGVPVTIHGANGFTVSGQAFLDSADCCPVISISTAKRDSVYAQTDYSFTPHVISLLGYRYEAERGSSVSNSPAFSSTNSVDRRNQSFIAETHGDFRNRLFYSLGGAVEKNDVFGVEPTPRVSLAYYPFRQAAGVFRGTKLKFNFGKGIKEPSVFEETSSLFDLLGAQPGGAQLIQQFGIKPIGAVRSRSYEFGLEQMFADRLQVNLNLFHNQFTDVIEFVSSGVLTELGVSQDVANASGFGATINSSSYRAQGVEAEISYTILRGLSARGGYTYLDAEVQRSFSNDPLAPPVTNPLFPTIPIGAFSPLVGARPFRRAPHTGYLTLRYDRSRWAALFQGTFVGRRDDSTFLLFSDINFDNTLLLPNKNLDSAYQQLDLSGDFRVNKHLAVYASMENLLNQRYDAAFGFPALPFTFRSGIKITVGGEEWRRK